MELPKRKEHTHNFLSFRELLSYNRLVQNYEVLYPPDVGVVSFFQSSELMFTTKESNSNTDESKREAGAHL